MALEKALQQKNKIFLETKFKCRIVPSRDYPESSIADYFLWVINRYINKEEDKRFFKALESKFVEIYDVYDNEGRGKIYDEFDKFDTIKAIGLNKK